MQHEGDFASPSFFSIESVLNFIKECNESSRSLAKSLHKIGRIELTNQMESWKRIKIFLFYNQSLEFFRNRVNFITECINTESLKNKEILDTLLRGLIEIYCRILLLSNSDDEEQLKRIIWQELYISALSDTELKSNKSLSSGISNNYEILRNINVPLPEFQEIRRIVQESLRKMSDNNKLRCWKREYGFPSVRKTIRDYLDETQEPKISKYQLLKIYSMESEQIHSNFYLEYGILDSGDTEKYRIISFLALIYTKFLFEIAKKARVEKDVEKLIQELKKFTIDYLRLWDLSKQFANKRGE
ncbi:MAG: hypothetical protein ACTSWX_04805 [Promethearchaeota archaeon]